MQQLKIQDEPRAYLEANVNAVRIQDVEDSWGESITFVSGQPALTDKVIHDAFGGHDDVELFHQPAALRSSTVMPHLWESARNHLLVKGDFFRGETPIGCFNRWWRTESVDYRHRHTNHFCGGMEGAVKSFMPLLPNREDISVHGSWCGQGSSGHHHTASPKRKRGRLNWPTWKHIQSLTTLLLFHWSLPASLLISAGPFLHLSNPCTAVAMLRSDYPKLRSQYERCSYANTHMYYSSTPSLTNPHLSQLYVSSCFSASRLLKLQKLHVCIYRSQQMELTSVAGWFSTTISSKLKNGPPWRAGSHTRVGESLHGWKKGSWQNLNGERKDTRGGSRDRGPGEIRRHCPSVQGWG